MAPYSHTVFDGSRRRAESFATWDHGLQHEALADYLEAAELAVVSAHEWRWHEGQSMRRRQLPTSTISWITAGNGRFIAAGRSYPIAAPCLHIVPAHTWHSMRHDPCHPFACIGIHYQGSVPGVGEFTKYAGFPYVLPVRRQQDSNLYHALQMLTRLYAQQPPGWKRYAQAELIRALGHIFLHHAPHLTFSGHKPSTQRLTDVLDTIETELENADLSVNFLAQLAGLSYTQLRTLSRQETGLNPQHYIQSRRVAKACRLLRHETWSIDTIAQAVGIPEARVFRRLFKRITGFTPSAWRKDHF